MLPLSFKREGFLTAEELAAKYQYKHLLIGTDGWSNTGKSEFCLSAPGPGMMLILDRGVEAMLDNSTPPKTRRPDWGFKTIAVPLPTQMAQPDYLEYWRAFYEDFKKCLSNTDARTIVIDGDSDSWELQKLAAFGKVTQVMPILHTDVNAARRAMIARAFDCGKVVIFTNKLKSVYEEDSKGIGHPTGEAKRQGWSDHEYLFQMQLRHFRRDDGAFGVTITRCKKDTSLEGIELVGDDCNFPTLMQMVYPDVPLSKWGYK